MTACKTLRSVNKSCTQFSSSRKNVIELKIEEANAGHLVKRTQSTLNGPLKGETDGKGLYEKFPSQAVAGLGP